MRCSTVLAILTGVLLYLVLGAVVFRALEAPQEEDQHGHLVATRQAFLSDFKCVEPENLQAFITVNHPFSCLRARLKFVLLFKLSDCKNPRWTSSSGVIFNSAVGGALALAQSDEHIGQ